MTDRLVGRMTALAAVTAGVGLSLASCVEATLPGGCVGDQCAYRPQRPDSTLADTLYVVALALLVVAAVALGLLVLRRGALGRTGVMAIGMILVGAVVAVTANVVQSVSYDGDMPAMPAIFLPSLAAIVVGFALLGLVVIRARVVPVWAGALVGLTLLLIPFGNQENTTVLLDVPFGLALALAGALVLRLPEPGGEPVSARGPRLDVEGA